METRQSGLVNIGLLWLRVLMGLGIASHGRAKLFGGGMAMFTEGVAQMGFPFPAVFAYMAAVSEFGGGILIALGLFARIGALFVFLTMSVAAFIHHRLDPFQVRELALAYWTMAGTVIWIGAGGLSLDRILRRKK